MRRAVDVRGRLTSRMVVGSGLLALLIAGAFAVLLAAIADARAAAELSRHSQRVLATANELERLLIDLESGQRGFVLTGRESFLEPWIAAQAAIPDVSVELNRLAAERSQDRRARRLTEQVALYVSDYSIPLVDAARRGDPAASDVAETIVGKTRVDALRDEFDGLVAAEDELAATRQTRSDDAVGRAIVATVAGLAGSLLFVGLMTRDLNRAIVRPVRGAAAMASQLAGGDLSVRMPENGTAEIGMLERSFNRMAGTLEESREELRFRAEEQGALRRIATLVARAVPPTEVFDAVAEEVATLLGAESTRLLRYEPDGTATVVAVHSAPAPAVAVGARFTLEGQNVAAAVLHTGRPAQMSSFAEAEGSIATLMRQLGIRAAVGAPVNVEGRLWGVVIAGWTDEASRSVDTVDRMAEFTGLVATAIANAENRAELAASRARVVAAADETRRRIERDLHDGTQQRLVSLGLELRAAEVMVPPGSDDLRAQLSEAASDLADVVQDLQEVSRGIHPAILTKGGLGPALRGLARRSAIPVELDGFADRRLPQLVEVAVYYVVSEALTNAAKHAQASVVHVELDVTDAVVRLWVRDDGVGGADPGGGSGLLGLRDRVDALGGTIEIASPPGQGTSLLVCIPIDRA
jgi:signal transduction histidine kinase